MYNKISTITLIGFLVPVILIFAILSFFSFCRGRAPPSQVLGEGARPAALPLVAPLVTTSNTLKYCCHAVFLFHSFLFITHVVFKIKIKRQRCESFMACFLLRPDIRGKPHYKFCVLLQQLLCIRENLTKNTYFPHYFLIFVGNVASSIRNIPPN